MKIAIPTRDNKVDEHFGHCEYYTLISLADNKDIVEQTRFEAPQGCGCKSNIASVLKDMNVDTLLAGNMGQGAVNVISQVGIKVVRGCQGEINTVVQAYISDKIFDSGLTCDHTDHNHSAEGHQCAH